MEVTEMYRMLTQITHGLSATHDGRLYAIGQPEPEWLNTAIGQRKRCGS